MQKGELSPLEENDIIIVGSERFIIKLCVYSGTEAFVYRCISENDPGQMFCIKEFFDKDAIRDENNQLFFPNKEKLENKLRISYELANDFKSTTPLGCYLPFKFDFSRMTQVMLAAPDNEYCHTLAGLVHQWDSNKWPDLLRLEKAIQIIQSLLFSIRIFHERKKLHGDLSPGNVLVAKVSEDDYCALPIDFSSCMCMNATKLPVKPMSKGYSNRHCHYALPQIDIYSVGCLLAVLCVGKRGVREEKYLTLQDLSDEDNIETLLGNISLPYGARWKLRSVLIKATTLFEELQYRSCQEFNDDLQVLKEIVTNKGVHREIIATQSFLEFEKQFASIYKGEFDEEILPETTGDILADNMLLWSDGGAGKTTILYHSWKQQLEMLKQEFSNSLPIYMSVAQFEKERTTEWEFYIQNSILREFLKVSATEDNRAQLNKLFEEESYILYLDSLDESLNTDRLDTEIKQLLKHPKLRICAASRSESVPWSCVGAFQKVQVKPLSEDVVQRKLSENHLQPVCGRLLDTLRVPMWLSIYLRLKINDDQVITPGDLLEKHNDYLLKAYADASHGEDWTSVHQTIMNKILPRFATAINRMYFTQDAAKAALKTVQQLGEISTFLETKGKNPEKVVLDMLVDAGILRIDENSLIFSHQRFLEFYVAKYIHNQMLNGQLPNMLCESIIPSGIAQFIGDLLGEYRHDKKRDCFGAASPVEQWLHDHMRGRNDRQAKLCIRNLIDTMRYARNGMVSGDYGDLDLSLVHFCDCCIPGSNFVNTTGIAEKTFLHCGHKQPIDKIAILHTSQRVVTAVCGERTIYFWDILTGEITDQIQHNENVHMFRVSADEQLLMVCTTGRVSVYRIEDGAKVSDLQVYTSEASFLHTQKRRKVLVDFYKDGRILCSCGPNGEDQVVLWDINTKNSEILLDLSKGYTKASDGYTQCSALSADHGTLYAVSNREELVMWDLLRRKPKSESFCFFSKLEALTISPNKKYAGMLTEDKMLLLMDLSTGAIEKVCGSIENDSCGRIRESNLIFATNDQLLWGGNWNLSGYKFETKKVIQFAAPQISALAIYKETIVFADVSGKIRIGIIDEQRVVSSFEWGTYTDWSSLHDAIPHVYDGGIARIVGRINQVQTNSENGVSTITAYGNHSDCFDKNYHICLETNTDELVIRDLRTGSVVTRVPYDSLCIAYDDAGKVIFKELSDFQWARYFDDEKKLVVNYWVGLTKIFDFDTKEWKPVGQWDDEIAHVLQRCEGNDRDTLREELLDIAFRTCLLEAYIVRATYDGRIQIWNLQGEKEMDVYAHKERVERIYEVPGGSFFVSEDAEQRFIWNLETFHMIKSKREGSLINSTNILGILSVEEAKKGGFEVRGNSFRKHQDESYDLIVYGEVIENYVLLACVERESIPSQRELSPSGRIAIYYDDANTEAYNSCIRVYDTATGIRLHNYDLLCARPIPMESTFLEFTNYSVNVSLDENTLAVAFADGCILVYDLLANNDEVNFFWYKTDAEDISGCYFENTKISEELATRLRQNGSIVIN